MRRTLLSCTLLLAAGNAVASTAWVSNEKDNSLSLIDMQTLLVTDTLPVGQRPRGLLLSHDHKLLYICASDSDRVQVMDVATRKIIKELPSATTLNNSPCTPTTVGCTFPTRTMRW